MFNIPLYNGRNGMLDTIQDMGLTRIYATAQKICQEDSLLPPPREIESDGFEGAYRARQYPQSPTRDEEISNICLHCDGANRRDSDGDERKMKKEQQQPLETDAGNISVRMHDFLKQCSIVIYDIKLGHEV